MKHKRHNITKYELPSQPAKFYRADGGPVGQLGYFLPGNPKIHKEAALEYGEEEFIYDAPRLVGGGNLLNLGDDTGGSAILLAQGLRDRNLEGHVFTVDNYDKSPRRKSWMTREKARVGEMISLYNADTTSVAAMLAAKKRKYPFIFIDADHSYEGVKADWHNFHPLLSERGIICFHDTNQMDGPGKVVKEEIDPEIWTMIFWVNRIKAYTRSKWLDL